MSLINTKIMVKKALHNLGYTLERIDKPFYPTEISDSEKRILDSVINARVSMVSRVGLINTMLTVRYVSQRSVPGDFVECGVWKGGNAILAAKLFQHYGDSRKVWLYDTFRGTTSPDINHDGRGPVEDFKRSERNGWNEIAFASLAEVQMNLKRFNVPLEAVEIVEGDVTQTLNVKENLPEQISILRLDTDWFYSTKKELEVLYPLVQTGGCLIIDDYGYSDGSRKATDDYFSSTASRPFFHYTTKSIRTCIKE